jgi:hypothetical protein
VIANRGRAIRKFLFRNRDARIGGAIGAVFFSIGSLLATVEQRSGEGLEIAGKSLPNKASHHIREPPVA